MRPLVVGPSPVITPSRTIVRASAAVLRQEISDGSRAPTRSAGIPAEAVIVFSFVFFHSQQSTPGMNEWLTIRSLARVFCKQLLIGRCDVSHGSSGIRYLTPLRCSAQAAISG